MTQVEQIKQQVTARVEKTVGSLETTGRQVAQQALNVGKDLLDRTVATLQKTSSTLSDLSTRIDKPANKA